MSTDGHTVYYLISTNKGENSLTLAYPSELTESSEESQSYGIFVFPRSENNRGTPRRINFPAMKGIGDNSVAVSIKLITRYNDQRTSYRFVCEPSTPFGFLKPVEFFARQLPRNTQLSGGATELSKYNLWCLVPVDRELLEKLWVENHFYFLGLGANSDDVNEQVPNDAC